MNKEKIGIVGLGKLGLPMMAAFISRGFQSYGYDLNENLIDVLRASKNPYKEPGIQSIIDRDLQWPSRFFNDLKSLIAEVDYLFLILPTPTKGETFDVSFLEKAFDDISNAANILSKSITCVITSTVNPGDSDKIKNKIKEGAQSKLSLVYSPEFIALGSVLADMLNPDVVLLGGDDNDALDKIFSIYSRLYKSYPEFHRLSFFEAETAKIAINTFITTKISYANTIGLFIEKATGSRKASQRVLNAVGGDSRIGRKYFRYGLSYGGPCFPRDNRVLSAHLKACGINPTIPVATDCFNNDLILYWIDRIESKGYDGLVIVGLAYKPGTDFTEESFMVKLGTVISKQMDVYFLDDLIDSFPPFKKLLPTELKQLRSYKKILVLNNYGSFEIESDSNADIVNIWN
jgi:UDPglucose 6-dehydrogenase